MELTPAVVEQVVQAALREDVGAGDLTTEAVIAASARCSAELLLEEPGVVCGLEVARAVFAALDPGARVEPLVEEGSVLARAPVVLARLCALCFGLLA